MSEQASKRLDVMELMPEDTPTYMAPAWLSCLMWATGKEEIVEAYRRDTGDQFQPASAPIDMMIDEATGRQEQFARAFVGWFNQAIWGKVDG